MNCSATSFILLRSAGSGVRSISATVISEMNGSKLSICSKNYSVSDFLSGFLASNNAEITEVSRYTFSFLFMVICLFWEWDWWFGCVNFWRSAEYLSNILSLPCLQQCFEIVHNWSTSQVLMCKLIPITSKTSVTTIVLTTTATTVDSLTCSF